MLMIVGLHYFNRGIGGVLNTTNRVNHILAFSLESVCIPAVNVFVLISGYYLISRKSTGLAKAIELYLLMVFYNLIALMSAFALGETALSFRIIFYALFPFAEGRKWFLETYILLLLFLPFLNILLARLSKKAHLFLIGVQILVFSVWPSFFPSAPILDKGYGLTNFITLFFIAAYIRRFADFRNPRSWVRRSLLGYLASIALIALTSVSPLRDRAWNYCYIFSISASVFLFVLFLNLPGTHNRVVDTIAGTTFDVYLLHAVRYLQPLVYHKLMHTERYMDSPYMVFHFVLCVILQFAACSVIGLICQRVWRPTVGRMIQTSKLLQDEKKWEIGIFSDSSLD